MTDPPAHPGAMSPERWDRIQHVLAAAIDGDPGDRARLLDERCVDDADLRQEVEALLAAHEGCGLVDRLADAIAPATSWARAQTAGWEGCQVGPYVVLELVGSGGMGLVYRARDQRLERYVALKFLPPHLGLQPAAKERFLVEARAAAALDHPNVCVIHDIGETPDGQLFIAMPVYDGETLQARLTRGRLPFGEALPIALAVARGLERAHACGIVHRDVKPSNVMLPSDGIVRILDFGIATMDDASFVRPGGPVGTIGYMSPEHLRGQPVDHRGDVWSLGVVLHEMLTGLRPFGGDDRQEMFDAILTRDPELVATSHPDVPAAIDAVLRRALAKQPEDRYPSMTLLASELASLALAASEEARPAASSDRFEAATMVHDRETPSSIERRRAAVIVTTVSRFDALVEHLGPVDAQQLVAQIRSAAVDSVREHGGLVNQAIGEEIVSVFGVPVAHEDDELRAVRAALELHSRVGALALDLNRPANIRVQSGIHVGPVVAQRLSEGPRRYAIVGTAPQVASRLAALAAPGDIVLSPECQRRVAPFVLATPGAATIIEPGTEPVTPFRVRGETGLETRLEAAAQSGLTPYVGRASELALVEALVDRARAGHGQLVTVVGDAGAGKSRLLHELRARIASGDGLRLLLGRCRAYGDVAPYAPFIDILREALDLQSVAIGDSGAVVARLREIDASLEPFVPLYLHLLSLPSDAHRLPRHLQGEHLQAVLLDALAALVGVLASRATLLVVIEDWQWADTASRAALVRMIELVSTCPILLVVTTRPERRVTGDGSGLGTQVFLDPLDFAASLAIIRAVLRVDRVSDDLARRVYEQSGGNPFFLEQVCRALLEQGAVAVQAGEAVVEGGARSLSIPDTVQAVIRARLDNLEPTAREVLRVASVIGRDFEDALLAAALGPEVDRGPAIARLEAVGLIQPSGVGHRFTHVLTLDVSYESLIEYQRRSLHGTIGRAIESHHADRLDDKAALLAHHFERAGEWASAVRYGRRAAARANALSQFADALAMLDRVLDWLAHIPDVESRGSQTADVLLQQERECETLGLRGRQREIIGNLIAQLAPRGSGERLAEAYLRQGDLFTLLKRFDAADRALSTALRMSRERGDTALERNILRSTGLLRWHEERYAEALTITEHALAIDRACGDEPAVAGDLTNLGNIFKSMGQYAAALPRLEEALAMPSLAEHPKKLVFTLHNLANVHRAMGDLDQALICLRRADATAHVHQLPVQRSFHLTSIAHIELQQGLIEQALRTYHEAVALSRLARHAEGLAQTLRTLGEVLFGLGRGDEALRHLQEAADLFAQLEDAASEAEMWSRAATVLERAGRPLESREAWGRALLRRQRVGDTKGQLDAREGIARAIRQLHEAPDEAIAAFETALDLASTLGEARRALVLRNTLGILEWTRGCYADALRHYEAALLLVRECGDAAQEAVVLNSLGVTLMKLCRPDEARTALEESAAVARQCGERLLEAHALAGLGQVSRMVDRPESALGYFQQSLALRLVLGDRAGAGWMLHRLATTRAALGDEAAAQLDADNAARIAVEIGDAQLMSACERSPLAQ